MSSKGYTWAIASGFYAACAAICSKIIEIQVLKYIVVIVFNVAMWGCYINSLKALSALQLTVTNFATNFIFSGLAGYFLFGEPLSPQWFAGAFFIVLGVFVLSKSNTQTETKSD